jgi:nucleoside-diphosphate-sugar epimerase
VRRVLVTHLDSAVGRRLAKALYHDPDVALVLGVGSGSEPSSLEPYRDKVVYERLDLARARHLQNFFRSERFARAGIDSVVHLPFVWDPERARIPGNVASIVSETRRLIDEVKAIPQVRRLVYLSSAFVYRPDPGNGNLVDEKKLLAFGAELAPEVRAWIEVDHICQQELRGAHLLTTILRAPTIVTDAGEFLLSPPLAPGSVPLGFDPMIALISDRDVARALTLALHGEPGVYNVAAREVFPLSQLRARRPERFGPFVVPASIRALAALLRRGRHPQADYRRHGLVLDTRAAEEALGFEPQYRMELRGAGPTRRVEPVRAR